MNDKRVVGMSKKLGLRRVERPAPPVRASAAAVENPETTGNPAADDPEPETPEPGNPESGNPGSGNPTSSNPASGNSTTGNPSTSDPTTGDPTAGNPTTGSPATGNPAADRPVEERPSPSHPPLPHAPARSGQAAAWSGPVVHQTKPLWPAPTAPASRNVLYAGAAAGLTAAAVLPLDLPGVGWVLTGIVGVVGVFLATGRRSPQSIAWAVSALLLLGVSTFLTADWLFSLSLLAASAAGSLAVTDGRSLRGVVAGMVAVPVAAFPAVKWGIRGMRASRGHVRPDRRLGRTILISAGLLLVFVPLLAGADAAFAELLGNLVPTVDIGSPFEWVFLFVTIGFGTLGACYVQATTLPLDAEPRERRTVARREWAVPIGVLVVVFAVFVGVQLASLFGGDDYVQRTAQLTYAEYARGGFWQLLAVTVLTLVVIGVATRFAATDTAADRLWLRVLLGGLAGLTLVIVASALSRMWAYQQAYGFTALRLLVFACEVWLAVVYLLVLAAGVRLRAGWLPRSVVATAVASLLVLAALNPDRFIAEHNVERWRATGKIDLPYLGTLSVDAVPAFDPLPADVRECLLVRMKFQMTDTDDWYAWNLSREQARPVLDRVSWERGCDLGYTTTR